MNDTRLSFARYEKKYLLSAGQYRALRQELEPRVAEDRFFESTVCSLYYDDDSFSLIRASIEGPVFKEKLRLRSYGCPQGDEPVFVELKKKFNGMVYKSRLAMPERWAAAWLAGETPAPEDSQVAREIDYVRSRYALSPKALVASDRLAYTAKDDSQLRITFDRAIRFRETELRLSAGSGGEELLEDGQVLMEIKMPGSAPLWLANTLSRGRIFPVSFSKYGESYKKRMLHKYFDGVMVIA